MESENCEINDRLERIGSSMIYGIVAHGGHDAFEKLVLKIPTPMNQYMERGIRFELPVMQWAADDNGWVFEKAETVRWEKDGVPYRDTPDFIIMSGSTKILAEVKTHSPWIREQYGEEYSSDVPDRVYCQCQFHMLATDINECRVIASFGGEKPEVFIVQRDRVAGKNIHKACTEFWGKHVKTKIPPEPNDTEDSTSLLNRTPQKNEVMVEAIEQDVENHLRLEEVKQQLKILQAEQTAISNYFKNQIGENRGIQKDQLCYSWKPNKPKKVTDYKAVAEELSAPPDLISKHTHIVTGNRVLRNHKPKGLI